MIIGMCINELPCPSLLSVCSCVCVCEREREREVGDEVMITAESSGLSRVLCVIYLIAFNLCLSQFKTEPDFNFPTFFCSSENPTCG